MPNDEGEGLFLELEWDQDDEPTQEHHYSELELRLSAVAEEVP